MLQDFGVDACLSRPVHLRLLVATIEAHKRRMQVLSGLDDLDIKTPTRAGEENSEWVLSTVTWTLRCPNNNDRPTKLSASEQAFLLALTERPGSAVSRETLINRMGHKTDYYDPRRLDTLVSRLRAKVNEAGCCELPLRTIPSAGYAFSAPIRIDKDE